MRKTFIITLSLVGVVFLSTFLLQCKTTKLDIRNRSDMSGNPKDFNDAIEKIQRSFLKKVKPYFALKHLEMKFSGLTSYN